MSRWTLIRPLLYVLTPLVLIVCGMLWLLPDVKPAATKVGPVTQPAEAVPPSANKSPSDSQIKAPDSVNSREKPSKMTGNGLDKAAILSMQQARLHGDSRVPPMSPLPAKREKPTKEQLADPEKYAQYEKAQQLKLYQSYVDAVPEKVGRLEEAIKKAKQSGSGITAEQIKAAKQEMAQLQAMREKLLKQNPKLVDKSQQTTASSTPSTQSTK